MGPEDFMEFKVFLFLCVTPLLNPAFEIQKQVREKMHKSLDHSKKFDEQDPSAWRAFVQWVGRSHHCCDALIILTSTFKAYEAMPSLISKYEGAWPVELYVRIILNKHIAYERHQFKKAVAKYKRTMALRSPSVVR